MIDKFRGTYAFLSSFYMVEMTVWDEPHQSVEHFFQSWKTDNMLEHLQIACAPSPAIAKKMAGPRGFRLPNGEFFKITLREDWSNIRDYIMWAGVQAKFDQNPKEKAWLINTYPHDLVEGNYWHDNYWGNCSCHKCRNIPGINMLGRILMGHRNLYL